MCEAAVAESVTIAAVPERVGLARAFVAGVLGESHPLTGMGAFFLRWLRSYGGRPVGARHPVSGTGARPIARDGEVIGHGITLQSDIDGDERRSDDQASDHERDPGLRLGDNGGAFLRTCLEVG